MASDKMLAEWFWVDRWMTSSAWTLPCLARGFYRELLSQAWVRGARLPSDPKAIQRLISCTDREWKTYWPMVSKYWRKEGEFLVNDTQVEVYQEAVGRQQSQSNRGRAGAEARHKHCLSNAQAVPKQDLSTAQALASITITDQSTSSSSLAPPAEPRPALPPRPKNYGRFDLHRWQVDALIAMLGPHADGFGLDVWLHDLSAKATERNLVLDPRVKWSWVQGELRAECEKRGLAIATAQPPPESTGRRNGHGGLPRPDRSLAFGASGPERWQCTHDPPCHSRMSCATVTARKCPHGPPCDDGGMCISRILEGDLGTAAEGVA